MRTQLFKQPVDFQGLPVLFMEEAATNSVYLTMVGGQIKTFETRHERIPLFDIMIKKLKLCGQ